MAFGGDTMTTPLTFTRESAPDRFNHCNYIARGELTDLSEWFTSYGFRATHLCVLFFDTSASLVTSDGDDDEESNHTFEHSFWTVSAGVSLFDCIMQALERGADPHNVCMTNEDGIDCVVYPHPTESRLVPAFMRQVDESTYIAGEAIAYFADVLGGAR